MDFLTDMKIDFSITVDFEVDCLENKSGMTTQEIINKVVDYVEEERNELVAEAKIAAIHLLAGEAIDGS